MQDELKQSHPELDITLLSINKIAAEAGIQHFTESHNLPMVQDDATLQVWNSWQGSWRDVYILNENNELVMVYNLTQNNLGNSSNYNALMSHFIDIATP